MTGLVLVILGSLLLMVGKTPFVGRLPGDIVVERENLRFYFPLAICLLLSTLLTLIFWLVGRR